MNKEVNKPEANYWSFMLPLVEFVYPNLPAMFRNGLLLIGLLSLMTNTKAAASGIFDSFRDPNRKIMPGHHHPIHRRYGHHGILHNGFLGIHNRQQTSFSGTAAAKKRRGTL